MARRSRHPNRRLGLAVVGLTRSPGLVGCAAPISSPSGTPAGHAMRSSVGNDVVVIGDAGTLSNGGVDTSSAVAVRVPNGTPVPPGCRSG